MPNIIRQTVLITGAAKRIGREIAHHLAKAGYAVAIHYHTSTADAITLRDELVAQGASAAIFKANLSDEAEVTSLFNQVMDVFGNIYAIVNNASRFVFDDARSISYHSLLEHIKPNLAAPLLLAKLLHETLQSKQEQGVVINLLDQKLFNPNPDFLSYTLTRVAMQSATMMLAQTLAPAVRVVGVAPGLTLPAENQSDEAFRVAHQKAVLGASSDPQDIAEAVLFLLTAKKITGAILPVDGGQHLVPMPRDIQFL